MLVVKKYPNRRLYDTRDSRYITLEDLEKKIRGGEDIVVQDATDGRDLSQEVLTQIILERGKGKILPAALLMRLIRLDDAALGEFLTRYVSWALDMYMQVKDRTTSLFARNPLAAAPFAAADAIARMALDASPYGRAQRKAYASAPSGPFPFPPPDEDDALANVGYGSAPLQPPPPLTVAETLNGAAPQAPPPGAASVETQMQQLREQIEALKQALVVPAKPDAPAKRAKKTARRAPKKR